MSVSVVVPLLPSLAAFVALFFISRVRGSALGMVPGWLASAAIAPVLATFFSVRMIIEAFRGMAMGGGGIAAVSAGLWEATQPVLWATWVACGLAIATSILAIRALGDEHDDGPDDSSTRSILQIVVIVVTFAAVVATTLLLHNISRLVMAVIDPQMPQRDTGIASVSQLIASRLAITAGTSVVMTLLLLAAVVVAAVSSHARPPRPAIATLLVVLSIVATIGFGTSALLHRSWSARLLETAKSGQFPR
jgi:hypothetical protein